MFVRGLATAAGWNGVLAAVAALWWLGLADGPPGGGCTGFGCGFTPREGALLAAMFAGGPMLAANVLVAVAVVGRLAAVGGRSAVRAGTIGAVAGWSAAAVALVAVVVLAVHTGTVSV